MNPILSPCRRSRVITARLDWLHRRRELAHLARRVVAAPPESARALAVGLVLIRAVAAR